MTIFNNLHIKFLALLSAIVIWLFVVGVENYVHLFNEELPVKIINLGQNVSVANEISRVKVRYKAPNNQVTVNAADFDLYLDVQGLGEGEYTLPVNFTSKNVNVHIVAVEPAQLAIKLEAMTSRDIELKSEISGSPSKDYEVKSLKLNLTKVKISGAASAINNLKVLPIKVTLDGTENADFSRKITLAAPEEWKLSGKTVSFDPAVVQADIEIRKKPNLPNNNGQNTGTGNNGDNIPVEQGKERKTLMVEIVEPTMAGLGIKELVPKNILVTVEGIPGDLARLDGNSLKLYMKAESINNGEYTVSAKDIVLPGNLDLKIITFSPEKVMVKF
jgi:YbbR domain-containing protein